MFNLSFGQIIFILIAILVLVGPKEIPTVLKTIHQLMKKLKGFQQEFYEFMNDYAQDSVDKKTVKENLPKQEHHDHSEPNHKTKKAS